MADAEYMESVRKALHLNQTEMAELLGYKGQGSISRIERGKFPMDARTKAHLKTIEANLEAVKKQLRSRL